MGTSSLDTTALRFNQAAIVVIVLLGFTFDQPALPAFVAVVLLGGSLHPSFGLFRQFYLHVLKPLNVLKPKRVDEDAAPHQFAQLMGGTVLAGASALLFAGYATAGWVTAWLVVILAAANLFFGFCAGCFIYFQLGKFGVAGFRPKHRDGGQDHASPS